MNNILTLAEINCERGGGLYWSDKGTLHKYLPIYERLFAPLRDKELNIFEVGYQHGGSAKLWERYFSKAIIKSIDIDTCVPSPQSSRIILEIADVRKLTSEYFANFIPDIAIDDGSHILEEQMHFISIVYPVLKPGGLLIIEDIQNINSQVGVFVYSGYPFDIIDLRSEGGRYDDVLLIFKKP
jgi:hypothetical protein